MGYEENQQESEEEYHNRLANLSIELAETKNKLGLMEARYATLNMLWEVSRKIVSASMTELAALQADSDSYSYESAQWEREAHENLSLAQSARRQLAELRRATPPNAVAVIRQWAGELAADGDNSNFFLFTIWADSIEKLLGQGNVQ